MYYFDDLDQMFDRQQPVNEFATRGRMQRDKRQHHINKAPGAVANSTRAATARFIQQYADLDHMMQQAQAAEQWRRQARRDPKAAISRQVQRYVDNAPKSSRAAVKARQRQLKDMGLYTGNIDGIWGPLSKAAHEAAVAAGALWTGNDYVVSDSLSRTIHGQNNGSKMFYLHYPDYSNHSKNTIPGTMGEVWNNPPLSGVELPVGHDAVILADKDGNTRYYEYGRIEAAPPGTEMLGTYLPKRGNVRRAYIPDMNPNESDSAYINRIKNTLPYADAGQINVSVTNGADISGAIDYINALASDPNRDPYSLANTCATFATNVYDRFRQRNEPNVEFANSVRDALGLIPTPATVVNNVLNNGLLKGVAMTIPNTTHQRYNSAKAHSDNSFIIGEQ